MRFACLSWDFFWHVNRKVASGKRGCRKLLHLLGSGTRCVADYAATSEEFEGASTEARSEGSGWLEIIMEGKLGKNNAGRLADAKQARAAHHSSGCSLDPHRVRTLARTNTLSAGPLRKRLYVLDIQYLLGHGQQCGRERLRQAPTKRTGLGVLSLCCIGTGTAAAAAGNGEFYD